MATKIFCDRKGCNKEIPIAPKTVQLSGKTKLDLCDGCYAEVQHLLDNPPINATT